MQALYFSYMNPRISGLLIGVMVIGSFITGAIVFPALPAMVPSHWNAVGEVTHSLPRFWASFLFPIILLVLWAVWYVLPKIDPINPGFKGFRHVHDFIWILIIVFITYAYAISLGASLGWHVPVTKAILSPLGFLLALIGLLMRYVKRNWFMGIRTPWSLSSDAVWDKTHKFGSWVFVLMGICFVLASCIGSHGGPVLIVATLIVGIIAIIVYSYVSYKHEHPGVL
jgi:uncharacterized membrane protein